MKLNRRDVYTFAGGYVLGGLVMWAIIMLSISANAEVATRVVELTTPDQVKTELAKPGPMVLLYSTEWCPGCKIFAPIYAELSKKMKDVRFLRVDADKIGLKEHSKQVPYIPLLMVGKDEKSLRNTPCIETMGQQHDAATTEKFIRDCLK